ncbi:transposase, MuDR, MULE transposase domain protein [Tanacetum coccineum]
MASNFNNENDPWEYSLDIDNSDLHLTQKVVEDVGEDDDFNSGVWFSATNYVIATGGTSCSPNALGDLNVTMKDLSGTIHHKVIGKGGYAKDIIVGAAMILVNVSVFTHKPSEHYLYLAMRNGG